ncbi:MAG TPA: nucleotidyl transferase AbiEii/AbiGii toxin family protein [Polyangiaceae bacterium]|nr:nucleotidyl transferase AbiEii/AbiGii toxin family protein [Polyangiaceae bacterium]
MSTAHSIFADDPCSSFDSERQDETSEEFAKVLGEVHATLESAGIDYALIGGIASSVWGRPRTTKDIDVFVRPAEAERVLECLEPLGFEVDKLDPKWIYKAFKLGVQVDVIFATKVGQYLDEEFLSHCKLGTFLGCRVRLASPEDLVLIKAIAHDEGSPRHWHDALGIVAARDLDWDYLVQRSRRGERRLLSLLLYAQSIDYAVPNRVIQELAQRICEH